MDRPKESQQDTPSPHVVASSSPSSQENKKTTIIFRSKIARYLMPVTLLVLIMAGLSASVFLSQQKQDVRNYAAESTKARKPVKIQLVVSLSKNPSTGEVTVESAQAYNTVYSPYYPPNLFPEDDDVTLEQVVNGAVVTSIPFHFNEYAYSPPPLPRETFGDPPVKLDKPEAILSIPFNTKSQLRVKGKTPQGNEVIKSLDMTKINSALTNIINISPSSAESAQEASTGNDGYLDILYIASHYGENSSLFLSDANTMGNFLKTIVPFKEMANKIRIQTYPNTVELGCRYSGRCILCNKQAVMNAAVASGEPYDTVVVIENNNTYGGCAYFGGPAMTYRDVNDDASKVMVHELGHSLIRLADEYGYGSNSGGQIENYVNCDESPSCRDWNGTPGINCFPTCAHDDWYKPTNNNCIMETLWNPAGFHFDFVDTPEVRRVVQAYTSGEPPVPTNPPATGCFNYSGPATVETNKYIRYSISLNGNTLTQYSSSGACYEATAGTGDPAGCTATGENCCYVGQTGNECGGHTATRSYSGTCTISATLSDGTSCSLSVQVQIPQASPTPTSIATPTPTPWIQVRVQNRQGQAVAVSKISRANCTASPCTQSMGKINVSSARFPGGGANLGGRITSSEYVVIGVTPSPNTGTFYPKCRGVEVQASCYLWPSWKTGKNTVTFVVATPTPNP